MFQLSEMSNFLFGLKPCFPDNLAQPSIEKKLSSVYSTSLKTKHYIDREVNHSYPCWYKVHTHENGALLSAHNPKTKLKANAKEENMSTPTKSVSFNPNVLEFEYESSCRYGYSSWYDLQQLYDSYRLDVHAARVAGAACPRGLEPVRENGRHIRLRNRKVVRKYQFCQKTTRMAAFLGVRNALVETAVAKFATKLSSEHQSKAVDMAKQDEQEATKINKCTEDFGSKISLPRPVVFRELREPFQRQLESYAMFCTNPKKFPAIAA